MNFVKWMLSKLAARLVQENRYFRLVLSEEWPLAVIAWLVVSSLVILVITLIATMFIESHTVLKYFLITQIGIAVVYLIGSVFGVAYEAYQQERHELFNTIKNSR